MPLEARPAPRRRSTTRTRRNSTSASRSSTTRSRVKSRRARGAAAGAGGEVPRRGARRGEAAAGGVLRDPRRERPQPRRRAAVAAYLIRTRRGVRPVFAPWHALAALPEGQTFAAKRRTSLSRLRADADKPINPLVARGAGGAPAGVDERRRGGVRQAAGRSATRRGRSCCKADAGATRCPTPTGSTAAGAVRPGYAGARAGGLDRATSSGSSTSRRGSSSASCRRRSRPGSSRRPAPRRTRSCWKTARAAAASRACSSAATRRRRARKCRGGSSIVAGDGARAVQARAAAGWSWRGRSPSRTTRSRRG